MLKTLVLLGCLAVGVASEDPLSQVRHYDHQVDELFLPETYQKNYFRDKRTGSILRFDSFTPFQQDLLILIKAEKLTQELADQEKSWEGDPAFHKATIKLHTVRHYLALYYEDFAEKLFANYNDAFTPAEKQLYLKKMRELHDQSQLIIRP